MKKLLTLSFLSCLLLMPLGHAMAGEIVLDLISKTGFSRQDFGTGTYTAYTMVWAGDVNYLGGKLGEFTATLTKTTYTGHAGFIINYDIIVPAAEGPGEFISVRTNHTVEGLDHGTIYAASPTYKSLIGYSVTMSSVAAFEDRMRILY